MFVHAALIQGVMIRTKYVPHFIPCLQPPAMPKQGVADSASPATKKVSESPIQSPIQQIAPCSPTPPPSPDPPVPSQPEEEEFEPQEDVDTTPVTTEPAEDEEVGHEEEVTPAPEETPAEENVEEERTEEPDLGKWFFNGMYTWCYVHGHICTLWHAAAIIMFSV